MIAVIALSVWVLLGGLTVIADMRWAERRHGVIPTLILWPALWTAALCKWVR